VAPRSQPPRDPWTGAQGPSGVARSDGALVLVDVRRFTPALVRRFLTAMLDELVSMDARDDVIIICDYEPSGLAFQLDLRRQTRGLFHYECSRRKDGAWIETIRRL
jgi:hypothetical protein